MEGLARSKTRTIARRCRHADADIGTDTGTDIGTDTSDPDSTCTQTPTQKERGTPAGPTPCSHGLTGADQLFIQRSTHLACVLQGAEVRAALKSSLT